MYTEFLLHYLLTTSMYVKYLYKVNFMIIIENLLLYYSFFGIWFVNILVSNLKN